MDRMPVIEPRPHEGTHVDRARRAAEDAICAIAAGQLGEAWAALATAQRELEAADDAR